MTCARKKMTEWERDDIYRRCSFPFSTDADTTWCLALLQDGHITLSKARKWLGEYLREGKVGPLPTTQEVGESIWHERDALRAQLAAAEQDARGLVKAIERGGFCLAEMMQAYERRIRSDCKSPDELGKRPWECAEYIAASSYLRTMFQIRDAAIAASPGEAEGGAT